MGDKTTVGDVLQSWSNAWNAPLDTPLKQERRRRFAFCGSLPWILYNVTPVNWRSFLEGYDILTATVIVVAGIALQAGLAYWFAWLISYHERKCSPARLFLEGLLLPALTATLLTGSQILSRLGGGGS